LPLFGRLIAGAIRDGVYTVVGDWRSPVTRPPRAEAFSGPSAQPVTTQPWVGVCTRYRHKDACVRAVSSICPVYFCSSATLRLPSTVRQGRPKAPPATQNASRKSRGGAKIR